MSVNSIIRMATFSPTKVPIKELPELNLFLIVILNKRFGFTTLSSSLKNYKWCCFALRSSLDLESPSIFFFPYAGCASEFLRFWLSTTTKMKLIFSRCQELARLMWFCLVFFVSSLGQNWSNVKRPLAVPSRAIYAPISSPISSKEWAWAELLRFLKLFSSRWFSFP